LYPPEAQDAKVRGLVAATAKGPEEFSATICAALGRLIAGSPDVVMLGDAKQVHMRRSEGILVGECAEAQATRVATGDCAFEGVLRARTSMQRRITRCEVVVIGRHNHGFDFGLWVVYTDGHSEVIPFESLLREDVDAARLCASLAALSDFCKAAGGYAQAIRERRLCGEVLPDNFIAVAAGVGLEDSRNPGGIQHGDISTDMLARSTTIEVVGSMFMRALTRVCAFNRTIAVKRPRRYFGATLSRTFCGSRGISERPFCAFFPGPEVVRNVTARMALGWLDVPYQPGTYWVARVDRAVPRGWQVQKFLGSKRVLNPGGGPGSSRGGLGLPSDEEEEEESDEEESPSIMFWRVAGMLGIRLTQDEYVEWRRGRGPMPFSWGMNLTFNALLQRAVRTTPDMRPFFCLVNEKGDAAVADAIGSGA
jgi:hypothetical protein